MEILVKARPCILAIFFLTLGAIGAGVFIDTMALAHAGGVLAHVALFLFLLTESFGSISKQRDRFSRIMARMFLVPSGLVVIGLLASLMIMALER